MATSASLTSEMSEDSRFFPQKNKKFYFYADKPILVLALSVNSKLTSYSMVQIQANSPDHSLSVT